MNTKTKQFTILLFQSITFWIGAFFLFTTFRFSGLDEYVNFFFDVEYDIHISIWYNLALILGLVIGVFYALIEYLFQNFLLKKSALGLVIISKTGIYLVLMIIILRVLSILAENDMDLDFPNDNGWWITNQWFWITVLYFMIGSLLFSFLKIANEKFGKGVFIKMLLGTYRKPQEEKRIFMFLDLKDSTRIAETLGHYKYSEFIQDCFLDLNRIIEKNDAEIYQYVGDEAVLTWPYDKGVYKSKCVDLYFAFQEQISRRKQYYQSKYKQTPKFKAGLHGGKLMIAEVGTVKKELAFHGDVINTTARIQGECNTYEASLLISESLLNDVHLKSVYENNALGNINLRGKQDKIAIYSITKKD